MDLIMDIHELIDSRKCMDALCIVPRDRNKNIIMEYYRVLNIFLKFFLVCLFNIRNFAY